MSERTVLDAGNDIVYSRHECSLVDGVGEVRLHEGNPVQIRIDSNAAARGKTRRAAVALVMAVKGNIARAPHR